MSGIRRRRKGSAGESLVELLITIVILGLTVPAIMGGILISVAASSQDRRQVQAQALLVSWAETIGRENTDGTYTSCPSPSYYTTAPFAPTGVPTGFVTSVSAIKYWNGTAYGIGCSSPDSGTRQIELKVSVPAGLYPSFDVSQSIVLRKPCVAC